MNWQKSCCSFLCFIIHFVHFVLLSAKKSGTSFWTDYYVRNYLQLPFFRGVPVSTEKRCRSTFWKFCLCLSSIRCRTTQCKFSIGCFLEWPFEPQDLRQEFAALCPEGHTYLSQKWRRAALSSRPSVVCRVFNCGFTDPAELSPPSREDRIGTFSGQFQ